MLDNGISRVKLKPKLRNRRAATRGRKERDSDISKDKPSVSDGCSTASKAKAHGPNLQKDNETTRRELARKTRSFVLWSLGAMLATAALFALLQWPEAELGLWVNKDNWSSVADALAAIIGIPTAVIGTLLAILLAYQAVWSSDKSATLEERQQRLEYDNHIADMCRNTLSNYSLLASSLYRLEKTSLSLYEGIENFRKTSDESAKAALTERKFAAVTSLQNLSDIVGGLISDPYIKSAWSHKKVSKDRAPVSQYYVDLATICSRNSDNPYETVDNDHEDEQQLIDADLKKARVEDGLLEVSHESDGVNSRFAVSRIGSFDKREKIWDVEISPLGLARYFTDVAEDLQLASIEELVARHRLALHSRRVANVAALKARKDGRLVYQNFDERGGFRIPHHEISLADEERLEREGWNDREGRSRIYFSNRLSDGDSPSFLTTLGILNNFFPRCHVWFGAQPSGIGSEKVARKRLIEDLGAYTKGQAPSNSTASDAQEVQRRLDSTFDSDCAGIQSDPVYLNRVALAIVALLEKIPMDDEIAEIASGMVEHHLTEDGLKRFTQILKEGDIAGRFSPKQHEAMGEFMTNAAALLWVAAPAQNGPGFGAGEPSGGPGLAIENQSLRPQ